MDSKTNVSRRASETASALGVHDPGLSLDERTLRAQGHVGELPREFSAFSTLATAYSITNSWIGFAAVFVVPLLAGGGPAVFWATATALFCSTSVTLGLAELASAFPSTGGQYHFAFMVAPMKSRAWYAFATGWFSIFAWLYVTASTNIYCAQICMALASYHYPEFEATRWQTWMLYVGFVAITAAIVCLLPRALPRLEIAFFWASLLGCVASIILLFAASDTKESSRTVWLEWENVTGWNDGVAFLLAVGQSIYCFASVDAATHLSEELPEPGKYVPRAMWQTLVIGGVSLLPMLLATLYCAGNYEAVVESHLPILVVYDQATGSIGVTTFFVFVILFVYFGASVSLMITVGRLVWAFSRDNGLPFSPFFAKTHAKLQMPVNATVFSAIFCILYGLIYIGSTTAFNSFISAAVLFQFISYMIPQAIVLFRGRKNVLPKRHFDLGPYIGTYCNIFSVCFAALFTVIYCLPIFLPVAVDTMNYVSVVFVGTVLFVPVMWFGAGKRHSFVGPEVPMEGVEAIEDVSTSDSAIDRKSSGTEQPSTANTAV